MKKPLVLIFFFCVLSIQAQHRFGVRAGLNYSTLRGEMEVNESYNWASGFHFGFNYTYQISPVIGLRAELLYIQRGTIQKFKDEDAYAIVTPVFSSFSRFAEKGSVDMNIDLTNTYLSIPITAQIQLTEKIELFGGLSLDMLFVPRGGGTMLFISESRPDEIIYELTLDHQYRRDEAGQIPTFSQGTRTSLIIEDEVADIFRIHGGYYNFTSADIRERGKKYRFLDSQAQLGMNYFINSGFYIGLRGELGLTDITNDDLDISLKEINADDSFIYRSDQDRSLNVSLSFGFRF